jgi:hypothetical protein
MIRARIFSFLFAVMIALGTTEAVAQVTVEEVDLSDGALGRYRAPAVGPVSHIAFLSIHRTADYRNHQSSVELANRGFGTLGIRTRFGNSEAAVNWELIALDIRNGVRFLRNVKGHSRVILVGRSGGGPSTSYYQAVAENGPSYCKGRNKITECPFKRADFTAADRADGIAFTDAHPGNGVNQLRSINGSVVNEDQPFGPQNKRLDPFDPNHGYNGLPPVHEPDGDSTYSDHFVDKYSRGQSRRMNDLIKEAQQIKKKIELGLIETPNPNDLTQHPFPIFRASARLPELSTGVHCCTLKPTRLLQDSTGTLSAPQIIHTVRVPDPGIKENDEDENEFEDLSLTSFLSANAMRSKHSLDRLDWCSSNNSTVCAVRVISVPTLVLAHQGHYFIRDGEQIYEESASVDKEFVVVEGATHAGGNCNECAAYHGTGPYMNVLLNTWNYVANWANARF